MNDQFCRIRLHFTSTGRVEKEEKMARGVRGDYSREAIILNIFV